MKMDRLKEHPIKTLEELLLIHLVKVYKGRRSTSRSKLEKYSDLLIDKFAIHAGTMFHLINGLIEGVGSTEKQKKMAIDVFSINLVIRGLMETYVTFHHLFVHPKNQDEKEFKLLLWKLEGYFEKKKFRISDTDFTEAGNILEQDDNEIRSICSQLADHSFKNQLTLSEFTRIFNVRKES